MKKFLLTTTAVLTILFTQAQIQCQSNFSYMQNGSTTEFTDLSTITPGWSTNYSISWFWDFGDNSAPSYLQNPTHTYSNGIYSPCLTVTFFDSVMMNSCTSVYCDSILIGNGQTASWDCNPANGCYDPLTGNGQYATLSACQSACTVTSSWDCNPPNMPAGCYDPGTGLGQYTTLVACQSICSGVTASWDCSPANGCYDPGTGNGQYTSFSACQSNCSSGTSNYCDSIDISITNQTMNDITLSSGLSVNAIPGIVNLDWTLSLSNGNVSAQSTAINPTFSINPWNMDSLPICLTVLIDDSVNVWVCNVCDTIVWNGNSWMLMSIAQPTAINELNSSNRELLKVVDILGRNANGNKNEPLFYIYNDGTVEKKIILE